MSAALTTDQQALCTEVRHLVGRQAERIARFNPSVDESDLVSAGNEALVDAAVAYRPQDGEFEKYAFCRVRGAMLDVVRRSMRSFGRERRHEQVMRPTRDPVYKTLEEATAATFAASETPMIDRVNRELELQAAAFTAAELEQEERASDDVVDVHHRELALRTLREAAEELGERERAVYVALYREERPVLEVAQSLKLSRRTITRIIEQIREHLTLRLRPLLT